MNFTGMTALEIVRKADWAAPMTEYEARILQEAANLSACTAEHKARFEVNGVNYTGYTYYTQYASGKTVWINPASPAQSAMVGTSGVIS